MNISNPEGIYLYVGLHLDDSIKHYQWMLLGDPDTDICFIKDTCFPRV